MAWESYNRKQNVLASLFQESSSSMGAGSKPFIYPYVYNSIHNNERGLGLLILASCVSGEKWIGIGWWYCVLNWNVVACVFVCEFFIRME